MTSPQEILATPMQQNDAEAATIREYLVGLTLGVWHEREGFSGKRPFGNSSWEYELYASLVAAGYVTATLDEDGYIEELSGDEQRQADALIDGAIRYLGLSAEAPARFCSLRRDCRMADGHQGACRP